MTMSEPKLLRKPLPPKEETELCLSKRKGRKGASDEDIESKEEHEALGVLLAVPTKNSHQLCLCLPDYHYGSQALGHLIMPPSLPFQNIKRDVTIAPQPSGPPSFPLQKHSVPLRFQIPAHPGYPLHLVSDLMLKGFAAVTSSCSRIVKSAHTKPILSRCNYEVLTSQLVAEQRRGPKEIRTLTFPPKHCTEFHAVEPRKPGRQMLIEMMLKEKLASMPSQISEETTVETIAEATVEAAEEITEVQIVDQKHKQKKKKKVTYAVPDHDLDFDESLISGLGYELEEDEEKALMAKAEMAVLCCLMHKRTGLNLKAYFLPRLPDLSPLADFLVYLNLSFNDLPVFPEEVFHIKTLEILKLRNNPIKFIPEDIDQMQTLKVLIMSFNLLTSLPSGLFALQNLQGLDVSYNELEFIPNDIENLSSLTYLNVEGNLLYVLPCGILKLPLSRLLVENNFLHPYFWKEVRQLQPQRLTDMAALCFARNSLWKIYRKLPTDIEEILNKYTACSCCQGYLYGEGLSFIRIYRNIYGFRLPYLFFACSPTCYTNFVSQIVPA